MESFDGKSRHTLELREGSPAGDDGRRTAALDERRTVGLEAREGTPSEAPAPPPLLARGTPLDRYVVLDPLGEGGMGMVYAAYDSVLDRKVALKLLPPGDGEGESSGRARLLREAQAMARLSHPHVVAVYDVHQHGAQVFIAMELVEGQTLLQWRQERPRGWRETLSTFLAAGRGLAAAHAAGLVHRDFKPHNVLVGRDGRARVTDFGLARPHNAPAEPSSEEPTPAPRDTGPIKPHSLLELELTQRGAVLGTPAYMAPEQFRGAPADARSDQFSFAVSLWEALHGERPFEGASPAERRENVLAGRLRPPPSASKVPPWVTRALLRALHTAPEERYPSLDHLLAVLERDPVQRWRRRLAVAGLVLLTAGSGALAWTAWHQRQLQLCTGVEHALDGIWDAPRQAAIERSFLGTGRSYARDSWQRVRDSLDAYTAQWKGMHQDTCEATRLRGEQSEDVMSLRMACMEGSRQQLSALTEVFTDADATVVERALSAVSSLRPLAQCADVEALMANVKPPTDASTRQAVETARAQLARVKALAESGRFKEALTLATEVSDETAVLDYEPIHAEALFLRAWTQLISGQLQGVPELLTRALWLAHASRHDVIATEASVRLMGYYSSHGPPEEAERWEHFARASLDRLKENGELRAIFHNNQGLALYQRGQFAEAYEAFDKAFSLAEKQLGPVNAMTLRYATNSLAALGNLDRMDDSQRALETLVRLGETKLGPSHPFLTQPLSNLASIYLTQGRLAEARRLLERVREIGQQAYGERSEEWAQWHLSSGDIESAEGHDAAALDHYEETVRMYQELTGPESPNGMEALVRVAETQTALERLGPAQQNFQQVLDWAKKATPQSEQVAPQAMLGLANLDEALGQNDKALRLRQQALGVRERLLGAEHVNTSLVRVEIANSYLELGQPALALGMFEKERALLEKALGTDTPVGVLPLVGQGEALLKLGRAPEALPLIERALQVVESHPGRPVYKATVQLALAKVLWAVGQQPERALKLAQAARATYARTPVLQAHALAEVDGLLARYPRQEPSSSPVALPAPP